MSTSFLLDNLLSEGGRFDFMFGSLGIFPNLTGSSLFELVIERSSVELLVSNIRSFFSTISESKSK